MKQARILKCLLLAAASLLVSGADKGNWPIKGRTNYPLLFDRQGKPNPEFHAVVDLVSNKIKIP